MAARPFLLRRLKAEFGVVTESRYVKAKVFAKVEPLPGTLPEPFEVKELVLLRRV